MNESTQSGSSTAPDGKLRFRGLRLSQMITVLVVLVALIAGSVVAIADYRLAAGELRQAVEEKLLALLEARQAAIIDYLASLRLTLHEARAQPRPVYEGIPFLGFIVYPDHRRLKRFVGFAAAVDG